jgi:hypothetical protein
MTNRAARIEALEIGASVLGDLCYPHAATLRAMLDELRAEATPPQAEALCECGHPKEWHCPGLTIKGPQTYICDTYRPRPATPACEHGCVDGVLKDSRPVMERGGVCWTFECPIHGLAKKESK